MRRTITTRRPGLLVVMAAMLAAGVNVAAAQVTAAPQHHATLEQVRVAIAAAEQRRLAAMAPDPSAPAELSAKWGAEVLGISYAADGFWLEFRFRVTDPAKAAVLFDSKIKPYLTIAGEPYKFGVAEASQVGSLRTTDRGNGFNIKQGRIYTMMFSNPGFYVQPGQKVSVAAGDFKVGGLIVRGAHRYLHVNTNKKPGIAR